MNGDVDSTIAARNAQLKKARQPTSARQATTISQTSSLPAQHVSQDSAATTSSALPAKQTSPLPSAQIAPRSLPAEVIIVSSDGEDDHTALLSSCKRGSDVSASCVETYAVPDVIAPTASERTLQQLFDDNNDFYESLQREATLIQQAGSGSASSVQMESLFQEGSASHVTSSCTPSTTTEAHLPLYKAPYAVAPVYASIACDVYGQPLHHSCYPRMRGVQQAAPTLQILPANAYSQPLRNEQASWHQDYCQPTSALVPASSPTHVAQYPVNREAGLSSHAQDESRRPVKAAKKKADSKRPGFVPAVRTMH